MFDLHTNHQNRGQPVHSCLLCQSGKMSQMAFFSRCTQKYLFLTFILFPERAVVVVLLVGFVLVFPSVGEFSSIC
jgi:hypothetical protein